VARDFRKMGDEPSNPELLDWLTSEFVASGWSLKFLHRLIVTSATCRQSSISNGWGDADVNVENRLLGHQNRRRLDGEEFRDALLAASVPLNLALNGPGVFPELPAELTRLSSKGQVWPVSFTSAEWNRRSLDIFVRRNLRYRFFEAFDRPDTNVSCPRRPVTTIAPQALSLLKSPLAVEAARALARRAKAESGGDQIAMVEFAYRLALGRFPDALEHDFSQRFSTTGGSFPEFCLALINLNEFVYID
jgi:Protein of unknown function (DUF1553)